MQSKEIQSKVIEIFSNMTEIEEVTLESELIEDLEISSMDVLFLISSIEEEFKIEIPEKEIRKMVTLEDVVKIVENLQNYS